MDKPINRKNERIDSKGREGKEGGEKRGNENGDNTNSRKTEIQHSNREGGQPTNYKGGFKLDEISKSNMVEKVEVNEISANSNSDEIPKPKRHYKKRETKSKIETNNIIDETQLNSLFCGMFSLLALKLGEHWRITNDEASQITKPLSNILERYNVSEQVSKMSDGLLLLMAVTTITLPRVLISREIQNNKKEKKKMEVLKGGKINEVKEDKKTNDNNNRGISEIKTDNSQSLKSLLATSPV